MDFFLSAWYDFRTTGSARLKTLTPPPPPGSNLTYSYYPENHVFLVHLRLSKRHCIHSLRKGPTFYVRWWARLGLVWGWTAWVLQVCFNQVLTRKKRRVIMVLAPAHVFMYFWPDFNKYARNKKNT